MPYIEDKNIGINAYNAGLNVKCNCDIGLQPGEECPTIYSHPSIFSNLSTGIRLSGGSKLNKITESLFEDNYLGINIKEIDDVIITWNDFFVGGSALLNLPDPQNIGIHTKVCSGYQIEENKFNLSINPVPTIKPLGIVVNESGEPYNEIYKNKINDLYLGINAVDQNRENSMSFIGLQILCNKFTDLEKWDIKVDPDFIFNLAGIASYQGMIANGASAGNEFTQGIANPVGNYENTTINPIIYYYNLNGLFALPANHTPIYVDPQISTPNTCPSQIAGLPSSTGNLSTVIASFYIARGEYYNLLYNYNQQIDEGNTPTLLVEIQNRWPQDAWDLRNELIAISPYVSQDVLHEAAFSGILPDALLLEVCLANPDATKNDGFVEDLENNIPNLLPAYMIVMIRNSWSGVTTRTLLERNIAAKSSEMNRLFNCVLKDIKSRDEYSNTDLIQWYYERNNISDYYSIADIYVEKDNYDSAMYAVNDILLEYNLDESQQIVYDNYIDYIDFRSTLYSNGKTISQIDSLDIIELSVIADLHQGIAAQNARNILCFFAGLCEPCYGIIDTTQNKSYVPPYVPNHLPQYSKVRISPNPANSFAILEWELFKIEEASFINILNEKGQIIENYRIENKIGTQKIITNGLSNGIYYYEFLSGKTVFANGKFVVIHE